jgi:hypothetical protein
VDRPASSLDIVPTVLEELGVLESVQRGGTWELQGVPLSQLPEARSREAFDGDQMIELPLSLEEELTTVLTWKLATFGSGAEPDALYRKAAPQGHLIGRPLPAGAEEAAESTIVLDGEKGARRNLHFDPASGTIPLLIRGAVLTPEDDTTPRALAAVVDGRVEATVQAYIYQAGHQRFSVLLPEAALEPGDNQLEMVVLRTGADEATESR